MFCLRFLLVTATILLIPGVSGAIELLSAEQGEVSCKSTSKNPYCIYQNRSPTSLISRIRKSAAKIPVSESGGICIAKKGATVSKIARDVCAGPLYKENGCLTLFLAQNPSLKNPDLIFPAQKLLLPKTDRTSSQCEAGEGSSESASVNPKLHRATFEGSDQDYLHMDAVVAQLVEVKVQEPEKPAKSLLGPERRDYLQMESVVAQLDPEIKSKASSIAGDPSKGNVFSRLVIPERAFLSSDGNLLDDKSVEKTAYVPEETESAANNYCIVRKGASVSKIARDVCAGPLYEEAGCLSKFLALNPIVNDPNLIFPGQKLLVPPGDRRSGACEGGVRPLRLPAEMESVN